MKDFQDRERIASRWRQQWQTKSTPRQRQIVKRQLGGVPSDLSCAEAHSERCWVNIYSLEQTEQQRQVLNNTRSTTHFYDRWAVTWAAGRTGCGAQWVYAAIFSQQIQRWRFLWHHDDTVRVCVGSLKSRIRSNSPQLSHAVRTDCRRRNENRYNNHNKTSQGNQANSWWVGGDGA